MLLSGAPPTKIIAAGAAAVKASSSINPFFADKQAQKSLTQLINGIQKKTNNTKDLTPEQQEELDRLVHTQVQGIVEKATDAPKFSKMGSEVVAEVTNKIDEFRSANL